MPTIKSHLPTRSTAMKAVVLSRPRPLVIAIRACLLGLSITLVVEPTATVLAQEPVAADRRTYNIPAGPLGQTLNRFASQSGITLSFDPALVQGLNASPLRGQFSVEAGLQTLLGAANLVAVPGQTGGYRVQKIDLIDDGTVQLSLNTASNTTTAQQDETVELEAITVTGTRQEGYRVSDTSALGVPLTVSETPASVTIISDDLLSDIAARDVDDFLPYVPGVSVADKGGGIRKAFNIRGFPQNSYFVDGTRLSIESATIQPIETIERIEVLKGPSGVESALASPGGYINIVTKKPEEVFSASVFDGGGDANFGRIGGDITGPLLGDGVVSGRLIAIYEQQQWARPGQDDRPLTTINPSLRWRLSDDTTFDVQFLYTDQDNPVDRGVIYLEGAGFDDNFAPRDWSFHQSGDSFEVEGHRWDLQLEHAFNDIFSARVFYRKFDEETQRDGFRNSNSEPNNSDLYQDDGLTWTGERMFSARRNPTAVIDADDYAAGAKITAAFPVGEIENTVNVGFSREDSLAFFFSNDPSTRYITDTIQIDVLDPDNDIDEIEQSIDTFTNFEVTSTIDSYYGQWLAEWTPRFRTITGIRYDEVEFGERETLRGLSDEAVAEIAEGFVPGPIGLFDAVATDNLTSYRLGGSYDLTDDLTLFAGYSTAAEPQSGFLRSGGTIEPIETESFELGAKWQFAGGRALLTGTVYSLERDNISVVDPDNDDNEFFVLPLGKVHIRGLEVEAVGKITDTLSVFGGFALQDSEILKSDDPIEGNRFANIPKFQASAFVNYNGANFGLPGLDLAVGVVHQGEREANSANQYQLPRATAYK